MIKIKEWGYSKMSRLQKYLINEKYEMRIKVGSKSYEVFVNPSLKEMREVDSISGFRFMADDRNKKVYVWDAYAALHEEAWEQIKNGRLKNDVYKGYILPGYSSFEGTKPYMDEADGDNYFENYMEDEDIDMVSVLKKWKWVNKYIDVNDYLGDMVYNE